MNKDMSRVKNKDIAPTNDKGQSHGFSEIYWYGGRLMFKAYYVNDIEVGYCEWYNSNNILSNKTFSLR